MALCEDAVVGLRGESYAYTNALGGGEAVLYIPENKHFEL